MPDPEYADYPGGEHFEPWQDHEWPEHHDAPARYIGEVGLRELAELSGGDVEHFLRTRSVTGPLSIDLVPPHAPSPGEAWDSTVHHFRCDVCGWDMLLWDAN